MPDKDEVTQFVRPSETTRIATSYLVAMTSTTVPESCSSSVVPKHFGVVIQPCMQKPRCSKAKSMPNMRRNQSCWDVRWLNGDLLVGSDQIDLGMTI